MMTTIDWTDGLTQEPMEVLILLIRGDLTFVPPISVNGVPTEAEKVDDTVIIPPNGYIMIMDFPESVNRVEITPTNIDTAKVYFISTAQVIRICIYSAIRWGPV